jgi:anti-anti-sigma factor
MLRRVSYPHVAVLGRLPGSDQFADRELHHEAVQEPGVVIVRVDASIVFANARTVKKEILKKLDEAGQPVRIVVLDLASTPLLDITGLDAIDELSQQLYERGIKLKLANMTRQVRDTVAKSGFEKRFGRAPESRSIATVLKEGKEETGRADDNGRN